MDFFKINDRGEYTPYLGLTVVSHLQNPEYPCWKNLYKWLMESDLSRYYAPLPSDSYHMTVLNLFNIQSIGYDKWEDFVIRHTEFFKQLNLEIENNSFTPSVSLDGIYFENVIQLILKLSPEQEQRIKRIAEKFNLSALIPPFFHITLAYEYQSVNDNLKQKYQIELIEHLSTFPQEFNLAEPKLCYFNDMTAFVPWDAEDYPFGIFTPSLKY